MNKAHVISEIQRTAAGNGGLPLGWRRFEEETGIGYYDWYGRFWTKWSDAVREAGFEPNRMNEAIHDVVLFQKVVALTRNLGRVPTQGDLMIAARNDPSFPSEKVYRRLGSKAERAVRIVSYCDANPGNEDVANLWRTVQSRSVPVELVEVPNSISAVGFVYLLKHGSRREYKIGRTNNPL